MYYYPRLPFITAGSQNGNFVASKQKKVILEIFAKIIPIDLLVHEYKHWHIASVGQVFL